VKNLFSSHGASVDEPKKLCEPALFHGRERNHGHRGFARGLVRGGPRFLNCCRAKVAMSSAPCFHFRAGGLSRLPKGEDFRAGEDPHCLRVGVCRKKRTESRAEYELEPGFERSDDKHCSHVSPFLELQEKKRFVEDYASHGVVRRLGCGDTQNDRAPNVFHRSRQTIPPCGDSIQHGRRIGTSASKLYDAESCMTKNRPILSRSVRQSC